jgi:hypothetical protein
MKSKTIILLSSFLFSVFAFAQNDSQSGKRWFGLVDYHQVYSFSSRIYAPGYRLNNTDIYSAKSLRLITGYYVDPRLSVGAGISIDNYKVAGESASFPFLVDVRGYLKDSQTSPYAYLTGGYSFHTGIFYQSALFEIGIGYKIHIIKSCAVNIAVGYNYKQYPNMDVIEFPSFNSYYAKQIAHSFSIGLGVNF